MIRNAAAQDAPAIAVLWNQVIRETTDTFTSVEKSVASIVAWIADAEKRRHLTLVLELDGQVLGFAGYGQFRAGDGYARCMEHSIHLDSAVRGLGHGRAMMAALEDHASNAGARQMIAGVSAENLGGIGFHHRLGYRDVGRITQAGWKWGRFLDLVLMQKILA